MKKVFFSLFLLIIFITTGCAKNKVTMHHELKNQQEFIQSIEQFQYDKTDIGLYAITNYIVKTEFLGYQGTQVILKGFYTGILHEMPATYHKLYSYYDEIHLVKLLKFVEKTYDSFEETLDYKFYPDGTEFIDTLWGYFYATGDLRTIKKMCEIQKHDYNHNVKNYVKMTLQKNQKKYPEINMQCK